jgi:hypothetical protein
VIAPLRLARVSPNSYRLQTATTMPPSQPIESSSRADAATGMIRRVAGLTGAFCMCGFLK